MFALSPSMSAEEFETTDRDTLVSSLFDEITQQYQRRTAQIRDNALPTLKRIHAERGDTIKNVVFPVSDGRRKAQVTVNLKEVLEGNWKCCNDCC